MKTKAVLAVTTIGVTVGLAVFAPVRVYAVPSFLEKQVAKECEASRSELRKSNEDFRRCIRQSGGREMIKDTLCADAKMKKQASTENFERCEYKVMAKELESTKL